MKHKVIDKNVLALQDFHKVFQVDCDVSGNATRDILRHEDRLVSYIGEKLNDAKRKYSIDDQEFNAIVQALKKWRHYLLLKEIVFYTNLQDLQYLNSQGKLNQRYLKWVEFL